jgi:HEAT repeat protein/tetratricopeptide (TPR) repeat protein
LAHIGEPAVAALTTALKDDNNRVRAKAAGVLARTGGISLENLLQALNDKDQDQETRAAVAEGLRWTEDARATKALIDLLNDENSKVRACAASALGRAGNKAAVGPLIGRLNDKDMQVRVNATFALGKIGDKGAVASLLAITRGESEGYRDGAFQALRMIGDPGSAEAVAKLLEASDPGTRLESLRTLGDFNHPLAFETPQSAKPVADLLLNKKEDWEVRLAAANTLRLYRDPYAMDALETVLKDSTESEDLRSRAAKSLGRLGTPGIERLMNLEQSNDVELKRLATTGLKEILVTSSYPDARYTLWWEVYMDALREVVGALATPAELDAVAKGPELPLAAAEKHPNPHIRSVAPLAEKIAEEEWDLHPLLRRLGKPNYPDSYPWGEAVNRVQCRLRMRQLDFWEWNRFGGETLWTGDDAPQIKMDIRNQGTLDLNCSVPPSQLRLEVDGVEYGRPRTETPGPQIPLWPGQQRNAFRVVLDKKWLRVERPLQMEAGKHTVRVVVQLNPTAGENFAVYSNPIEVKVFPSKKERYELQNFRIEAGFVPDRNEIQAGEELGVESYVRNVGDAAFGLRVGGDGRGVRPTRFKISAVDADGNKVTDPNANAMNMGGFGGCPMIEPGKSYAESLFLSKWCEFVKPGVYTVTCTSILRISKDGTSDFDERKMLQLPIETRFTLTVKEPTAQDAREKVESMLKNRDKADFSILRSPVYLPVLREYAAKEDGDAVKGIGSIQTPEATKALIALAEDWLKQGKTALAFQAIRPLRSRLPNPGWYPADQSKASGDGYFAPDRERVERTWRAEFALPMRGMARRLVRNTDQESLETGGYILQCVGTAEDLPDLMIGYTNAIEATKTLPFETHQYFRPRGASYRYRFAARQLIERGGAVPEKPNTPGEAATYLIAMQAKKDFRPADWPQRVLRWLDYATPYMREFVLDFMPDPIPDAALDKIPALLADPYVDLQIAACHTAQKHPRETFREPLLAILDKGTEQYLLNAAAAAAPANGIPTDRTMEIWVRRMDRNDLGTKAVIRLLLAILDNNQRGDPQELSAEATAAAQARWKRFIEENREKLRQGKRFKIGDPEITPDLFPPGFTWYKDDKAWPPQNDPSSAAVTGTKRSSDAEGVADFTAAPKASDPPTTATADVQSEPERLVARSAPGVAGEERKKLGKGESAESIRFPSQPDKAVPGSSETAEQKIQRSIARWDFTRAIPAAGDLLKRAPDDPARGRCHLLQARAYGVWGVEYRDAVARDKGRRHLEQAFALNPGLKNELDVARLRAFFFAYRQSSKSAVNQALADAQKEIKSHPRDAQAHYYLGMLHHVLATNSDFAYTKPEQDEERRLALESMAKAVELDPKRYEYWSYYVSAFAYAGQKEEAKKAADRMMKEADLSQEKIPPSATCAYEIMSALMAPEEGYAYLRAQAARDPSYAPLQFVAAERYDEKDPVRYRMLTDLAARIASGDLRLPPWQARLELQTLYKSGSLHYQAGEFEKALEDYDRIISLSPYYAQVRLNRGSVHRVLAEKAATPEEKARLLEKAKNDFEAGLQYPWHDQVAGAKEELDKTVKDLEPLRAVLPAGPSKNAQESRTEDAEWGEAVDGVQVRLRVEKAIWNAGEILTFKVDLLNQGTRRLSFDPLAKELDLSGHWYRRLQPKRPVEGRPLGPRTDYSDISVDFDSKQWADGTAPHASPPAPGKYTVRVAFQFRVEDGGSSVRAVSNPVEIEVGVPGEAFLLGTVSFRILSPSSDDSRVPENTYRLPPGEYQVFQEYRFARIDGEATDGTDKSTFRSGALPLTVVKALPVQSP